MERCEALFFLQYKIPLLYHQSFISIFIKTSIGILVLFYSNLLFTQNDSGKTKKIELIHADVLEYDETSGIKARKLIGNVHFKHEDADMFCDSAYLFNETNSLKAFSKVKIVNVTGETITGDSLDYNGNTKFAKLRGRIKMIDKEREVTTSFLDYNLKENIAYYFNRGTVKNNKDKSILKSVFGYYYTQKKEFFFKDQVLLTHPDYTIESDTMMHNTSSNITYFLGPTSIKDSNTVLFCYYGWFDQTNDVTWLKYKATITKDNQVLKGDSIYYEKKTGIGQAYHNVSMADTTENLLVTGDYGYYNEKDSSFFVTFNALLTQFEKTDTFYLHADTLFSFYDSVKQGRVILAYYKSKFYKNDIQGMCDSLVYKQTDSIIQMYINPILWSDSSQLSASYIEIKQKNNQADSLWMKENAMVVSMVDTIKYNQVYGDSMKSVFKNNAIENIYVYHNAKTLYYPDDDKKIIGLNKASSKFMNIYVEKNNIKKIKFYEPEKSELIPLSQVLSDEMYLKGFKWIEERRPKNKYDVFVW